MLPDDLPQPSDPIAGPLPVVPSLADSNSRGGIMLDEATQSVAGCARCGTKASWRGAITEDMIARSFTRGVVEGVPNCPRCGSRMQLQAITPIEDHDAAPRQQALPGIAPAFDFEAAFDSIIEHRAEVKLLASIAATKQGAYKVAKQNADEAQEKLSALEDEYATRAEDARYQREGAIVRAPTADDLRDRLRTRGVYVTQDEAIKLANDTIAIDAVVGYLESGIWNDAIGRPHLVGDRIGCVYCGALYGGCEATYGVEAFVAGVQFGLDCDGPLLDALPDEAESLEMAPGATVRLLTKAGADVSVEDVTAWSVAQRDEARTWALAQIDANKQAGRHPSVRWPDHVAAASGSRVPLQAPPAPKPARRQATTGARTRSAGKTSGAKGRTAHASPGRGKARA